MAWRLEAEILESCWGETLICLIRICFFQGVKSDSSRMCSFFSGGYLQQMSKQSEEQLLVGYGIDTRLL